MLPCVVKYTVGQNVSVWESHCQEVGILDGISWVERQIIAHSHFI